MKRQLLALTVAATALLAPLAAHASGDDAMWGWMNNKSQREGYYVGGGGLAVFQQDADSEVAGVKNVVSFDPGWGLVVNGGYAWGNGLRTEAEFAFRRSGVDGISGTGASANGGHIRNASFMGNALYDFDTGTAFTPYVGAGLGAALVDAEDIGLVNTRTLDSERMKFAYQAIGGVSYALDHNWALTTEYRYFRTLAPEFHTSAGDHAKTENAAHNLLVGVRYSFGAPEAAPVAAQPAAAPMPMAQPAARPAVPAVPQSYMVFFDFNKATLTPEAKRIIASAAQDYKKGRYVRIMVTGHTDTVGTVKYNLKLSERRAQAVKGEFASLGVAEKDVAVKGVGKEGLLVPTNDQVREAQNRRAEIVFGK